MGFFSDERANELRDLFFESAQELLQTLNDEGLELEQRPRDPEIVRDIRRTVHTLKGDSAACGFRELSELAHEMEDALTNEVAASGNANLVELVLNAADSFDSMLSAYRSHSKLPSTDHVRQLIANLTSKSDETPAAGLAASFDWTEYERLAIQRAAAETTPVYCLSIEVDANCPMRMAALQLLKNVLHSIGTLLAVKPEGDLMPDDVGCIRAALASSLPPEIIQKKIQVPSITRRTLVQPYRDEAVPELPSPIKIEAASIRIEAVSAPVAVMEERIALPAMLAVEESESETSGEPTAAQSAFTPETLLRVDAERIDTVLNLVGELIIGKSMLNQTLWEFTKVHPKDPLKARFADAMAFQAQVLNELQRSVMKIRMVPVENLFRRFPRVVRDVARTSGKDVELVMSGQATDLDKSILDALAEPMMHLVRNAVDHGIEAPSDRVAAGKAAKGRLKLNAYYQGNQVVIELSDDGAGIDRERVVKKAVENNIVSEKEAEKLSEQEALQLIFRPGLSTASEVTEISGRGMGMDIVDGVLGRLKGSIGIQTERGRGTTFQLRVPLTLAIMQALLFRVAERLYAVPLASVIEITRTSAQHIHTVDHHEVLQLRDQIITLVRLDRLEGTKRPPASTETKIFVVVVALGDRRFGLVVDKLAGEEELVIKALEDNLVTSELVSGASILGDGTVVLILNVAAVVERLGRAVTSAPKQLGASA